MTALDLLLDFAGENPVGLCLAVAFLIGAVSVVLMGLCDATDQRGRG